MALHPGSGTSADVSYSQPSSTPSNIDSTETQASDTFMLPALDPSFPWQHQQSIPHSSAMPTNYQWNLGSWIPDPSSMFISQGLPPIPNPYTSSTHPLSSPESGLSLQQCNGGPWSMPPQGYLGPWSTPFLSNQDISMLGSYSTDPETTVFPLNQNISMPSPHSTTPELMSNQNTSSMSDPDQSNPHSTSPPSDPNAPSMPVPSSTSPQAEATPFPLNQNISTSISYNPNPKSTPLSLNQSSSSSPDPDQSDPHSTSPPSDPSTPSTPEQSEHGPCLVSVPSKVLYASIYKPKRWSLPSETEFCRAREDKYKATAIASGADCALNELCKEYWATFQEIGMLRTTNTTDEKEIAKIKMTAENRIKLDQLKETRKEVSVYRVDKLCALIDIFLSN
jgi:hypothetical protein